MCCGLTKEGMPTAIKEASQPGRCKQISGEWGQPLTPVSPLVFVFCLWPVCMQLTLMFLPFVFRNLFIIKN
jgi:hypothetical protein